jgi:hypothetical protein
MPRDHTSAIDAGQGENATCNTPNGMDIISIYYHLLASTHKTFAG